MRLPFSLGKGGRRRRSDEGDPPTSGFSLISQAPPDSFSQGEAENAALPRDPSEIRDLRRDAAELRQQAQTVSRTAGSGALTSTASKNSSTGPRSCAMALIAAA